ncbi:MAG: hypothetical protein ACR2K3_03125 [Nocardioides sp.]
MQTIGNLLTILGILVTFLAYFGQHSGVSVADLEPGLTARWNRARGWVRRRLCRNKTVTLNVHGVRAVLRATSPRLSVWSTIQPGDDIAVRAAKLARNLDTLRDEVHEARAASDTRARELEQQLTERLNELDQMMATRHEESRKSRTAAMRWEVRGLLITLLGAGLGILG